VAHPSEGVVGGTGNHTGPQALGDRATGGVEWSGLIGWALAHMIKCGATAILVAPQWEAHNWWPWLLQVKQLVWPLGRVHDMVILGLSGVFKPVGVVCISHQQDSGQGMADLSTWVQELLSQARAPGTLQTYTRWVHEFSDFVAWTTGQKGYQQRSSWPCLPPSSVQWVEAVWRTWRPAQWCLRKHTRVGLAC